MLSTVLSLGMWPSVKWPGGNLIVIEAAIAEVGWKLSAHNCYPVQLLVNPPTKSAPTVGVMAVDKAIQVSAIVPAAML